MLVRRALIWPHAATPIVQAREVEASDGISCDVLDLQTLLPWDVEAAEASLNRTGR